MFAGTTKWASRLMCCTVVLLYWHFSSEFCLNHYNFEELQEVRKTKRRQDGKEIHEKGSS
jgi:hypothetical protein